MEGLTPHVMLERGAMRIGGQRGPGDALVTTGHSSFSLAFVFLIHQIVWMSWNSIWV